GGGGAGGGGGGGVKRADRPGGGELGVALDDLDPDAELVGEGPQQRRLAGAGRPFQEDGASGGERGHDDLQLPPPPDAPPGEPVQQDAVAQNVITPRMFLPSRMSW